MPTIKKEYKFPGEVISFGIDFAQRLAPSATISSQTTTRVSGDCTVGSGSISGTIVSFLVSSGTAGTETVVKVEVVCSNGETLDGVYHIMIGPIA